MRTSMGGGGVDATRVSVWVVLALLVSCELGCGDDDGGPTDTDGGDNSDAGAWVRCQLDSDCDDGVFCNGIERCRPDDTGASLNAQGCVRGTAPQCNDGIRCTTDVCSHTQNRCLFVAPDADGDGRADAQCLGPNEEPLGDDCDDNDPFRHPGNPEVCSAEDPEHDEDCDPTTFGVRDLDRDGADDDVCCNLDANNGGTRHCGSDCDDDNPRVREGYPELCDLIDNDCNGSIDDNTIEVPWYADADGDSYGDAQSTPVIRCAVVLERSVLDTDCDDTNSARHPAAREVCNGIDDDCDGTTDEGDACRCGAPGLVQPCICNDNRSGFTLCQSDGRFGECDCRECVDGAVDCLGGLIPRACIAGRWIASTACSGVTPVCTNGACLCLDGTSDCTAITDVVPPFVQALIPGELATHVMTSTVISVVLSESIASSSVNSTTFRLFDVENNAVAVTHHTQGNTITLVPAAPLHAGRSYRVELDGVTDIAGNALSAPRTWRFLTALDSDVDTLATGNVAGPVALHTWPNERALVIATRVAFNPGQVVTRFEGSTRSSVVDYEGYAGSCVGLCIGGGAPWAMSSDGTLAAASFSGREVWTGLSYSALALRGSTGGIPSTMRYLDAQRMLFVYTSPLNLEYWNGVQVSTSTAGITGTLLTPPAVASNTRGDVLLAIATAGNGNEGDRVRIGYGAGALPGSHTSLSTNSSVASVVSALNDTGAGLVAWTESYSVGIGGGPVSIVSLIVVSRVSATGTVGARVALSSTELGNQPIDDLQVVPTNADFWIVYRRTNQLYGVRVGVDTADDPIVLSNGPRVVGTLGDVRASGEADGTLHVVWMESNTGFTDAGQVVSARRRLPNGALTPIRTLLTGHSLGHLNSGTYGARATLTTVFEGGDTPAVYAIRH